jgi:ribonuclease HII
LLTILPNNIKYESTLWNTGTGIIAGVDEVGRGCLAGPLVTAAVVWPKEILTWISETEHPHHKFLLKIKDSKKVTAKNREILNDFIQKNCEQFAIVEISSEEIDQSGVGVANIKALENVSLKIKNVEYVLVDHHKIFTDRNKENPKTTSITEGESHSISIAAASIIAKVYRDKLMKDKYHALYPQYGFDTHVGYGTKKHIEAIKAYGVTPIHRKSFLKNLI